MTSKGITLRVSRAASDWPGQWPSMQALSNFGNGYIAFAKKYLLAKGYYPVHILITDNYIQPGRFSWQDDQAALRIEIMSKYLNPDKQPTKDLNYINAWSTHG